MSIFTRLQHGFNAFMNKDEKQATISRPYYHSGGYSYRPDRPRFTRGNERSIITSVFNRIALDAAAIDLKHVKLDENGKYTSEMKSGLNECLTMSANIDQTARAFKQDIVMSMLDEGCVAIVPVDTTRNPNDTSSYDIDTMRTGKVIEWFPQHVKVHLYNDRTGEYEDIILPKTMVGIVENPLYAVVNEPNSMVQRLKRKLVILDAIDEHTGSGKLDLIIQLPYTVKGKVKREQAETKRKELQDQLASSQYGIGYIDATEKIVQLNRPIENNLLKQIEYLTNTVYSQLGITQGVMDGSADEKTMRNYTSRTVEPIVSAIVDEMKRKFITKTARTQGQSILMFNDPFKLVPVSDIAEIADKLTRNEIATSNEIRQVIGWAPSDDPGADELRNKNLNQKNEDISGVDTSALNESELSDDDVEQLVKRIIKKEEENQNGI